MLRCCFGCPIVGVGGVIYSVGLFFILFFCFGGGFVANSMTEALDDIIADASTASAALGTVAAGTDVVVSNFAGLAALVDELSAFALLMKDNTFYTPVGGIIPFAGASAPGGWKLCNGDTWATLGFSAGNDLYDLLQPLGWLGVPDLRGRVIVGVGSHADVSALRLSDSVTLANRSPKHQHTVYDPGHAHSGNVNISDTAQDGSIAKMGRSDAGNQYSQIITSNTTGVKVNPQGTATSTSPVDAPPYLVTNYIIKY